VFKQPYTTAAVHAGNMKTDMSGVTITESDQFLLYAGIIQIGKAVTEEIGFLRITRLVFNRVIVAKIVF
jgi:hypothetical protein